MELIFIWILTIIVSFAMQNNMMMQIFKEIADQGYMLNLDKLLKVTNQIDESAKKVSCLALLIPGYNLFKSMQLYTNFIQHKDLILNQYDVMGVIEEMSEWELLEYNKKPTGLNAYLLPIKLKQEMNNSVKITIPDPEGIIWYKIDPQTNEIVIVKSEGLISQFSLEEQKSKVQEIYVEMVKAIEQEFGSFENFEQAIKDSFNNGNVNINLSDVVSKTPTEKIEDLKQLKDELTDNASIDSKEKQYQKINKKK